MLKWLVGEWKGGGAGGDEGSLSQWPNTRDKKVEICELRRCRCAVSLEQDELFVIDKMDIRTTRSHNVFIT